jgi:hypothetical protein
MSRRPTLTSVLTPMGLRTVGPGPLHDWRLAELLFS